MRDTIVAPNAPVLMESTRSIGYSPEAAIADVIDNSLTAGADRIDLQYYGGYSPYIFLLDNGVGMNAEELTQAMRYGSKNPIENRDSNDLGRYGLGLKTASLSQCRRLTVITKRGYTLNGCQWDLDYVIEKDDWILRTLDNEDIKTFPGVDKLMEFSTGTLVIWQELDKFIGDYTDIESCFRDKFELINPHLALVFHRYLTGETDLKKVELYVNARKIEPTNPFLLSKSTQVMDDEIIDIDGERIVVKPYLLPHLSKMTKAEIDSLGGKEGLTKTQGFYVYRNKRLLVKGTWFRLTRKDDLSKLARVQVDIPNSMDDLWTLDIKKSKADPPEIVKRHLRLVIDGVVERSKRTWLYKGKKELDSTRPHIWHRRIDREGNISYEISEEIPLVQMMLATHPDIKNKLHMLLKAIAASLPLNTLYADFSHDSKTVLGNEIGEKEAIESIREYTKDIKDDMERSAFIEAIKWLDVYREYADEIDEARKRGVFDV